MNNILQYKGFKAQIEIDFVSGLLHGKLIGVPDLVTFESEKVSGVVEEFHEAVDDYLEFCHEVGRVFNESEVVAEYA